MKGKLVSITGEEEVQGRVEVQDGGVCGCGATDQAVHTARMHLSENSKKQPNTVDINVKFICPKQKYTMCKSTYKRKNHNKHDKIVTLAGKEKEAGGEGKME